jgi:phosphomannomutase/phosphoglucomutase
MRELIQQGEPVIFGGEGNGGLIFPDHQFCRDGGMTAAMMLALLSHSEKSLSELVARLPKRYIIKDKLRSAKGSELLASLVSQFPGDHVDKTDGAKIFKKDAWALVRASGTEPIIRIIIDADSPAAGEAFHRDLKARLESITG